MYLMITVEQNQSGGTRENPNMVNTAHALVFVLGDRV